MNKYKLSKIIGNVLTYTLLIIMSLGILLPVVWIVISSLQKGNSLYSSSIIPKSITFDHYIKLFQETDYPRWYLNTLRIATLNMIFSVIMVTITAYGFSRYKFKGKKQTMIGLLILQMFPSILTMIAVYIILDRIGLLDSYWGLLVVYGFGQLPYNAWLTKGYFDGIPKTLDEAARIDGASDFTIFYKVIMPLARPIIVLVALSNFMGPWFDFIFARLVLRSREQKTLAIGIFEWIQQRAGDNFTQFAAGAILVAVPITILFMYLQNHIVEGLSAGAVKG